MDKLEERFDAMRDKTLEAFEHANQLWEIRIQSCLDRFRRDVEEYEATGILPDGDFSSIEVGEANCITANSEELPKASERESVRDTSVKENNSATANQMEAPRSTRRTRLTANNPNVPVTLRHLDKVVIKMERITETSNNTVKNTDQIKQEFDQMPPPAQPPIKRTRTRKTSKIGARSNIDMESIVIKQEKIDKQPLRTLERESDVILQANQILNVTIVDSDEEIPKTKPTRTRTKKRILANTESDSSEDNGKDAKQQRPNEQNSTRSTRTTTRNAAKKEEPDVIDTPGLNKTKVISKINLNTTVVLSKNTANATFVMDNKKVTEAEKQLLTDDEDVIDNSVKESTGAKKKNILGAYAASPVKTRVAAFEKLGIQTQMENAHSTRAKTKKKVENGTSEDNNSPTENKKKSGIPKLRGTPTFDNKILLHPTSTDRPQNPLLRSKSALKASQAENRERELRRKQKEALINSQMEEKRRRNEERQLKAQQQRDALEKEKQHILENAERIKQDKLKMMLSEKDDKLLKQRDEANKRRQLAVKKAALEKQKHEEEVKKQINASKTPIPLLPTPDCYDSDDSTNANRRIEKPAWQSSRSLYVAAKCISYTGNIKNKLFCCRPQCPDIRQIFPGSKPLKRNSSVIWDTSISMLAASMIEEEQEE